MKNFILVILLTAFTTNLNAQFEYDCIGRNEFYIIKTGSNLKSASIAKASGIKNSNVAEQQFGSNYKAKKQFAETENAYYNKLVYDDGLEFRIPENQRMNVEFHITSDKYILKLANGQTIKVGMKSDELKAIFPKSFLKSSIIDNVKGKIGKVGFSVYFSRVLDGKLQMEDSCIEFILNGESGILEEFYSWEPA